MRRRVPRYFQIAREIIAAIRSGRLRPGTEVPSENELIARYGVSNTTARRVHAELEQAGWVTRVKGRGTYVRESRVSRSATRILGFTRNMIEAGRTPSTRLIEVKPLKGSRTLAIDGRQYRLRGPIWAIRRLRLADGVPMMSETRYVSGRLCPGIQTKRLEASLYDIYEREYGLHLLRIDQVLSAVVVDGEAAGFPGVRGRIPAFRVEGVTFCAKELVLEMEESVYRGDMYRFVVRATRRAEGTGGAAD